MTVTQSLVRVSAVVLLAVSSAVSERLSAEWKQPVVVENRIGASGNIGAELVARAAPDGHSLLVGPDTIASINPHIFKKLTFNPLEDLVPVIYLASTPQMRVCNPAVPVKDLRGCIAHARSQKINYASGGPGVPGHMAMELFRSMTGIDMVHIPYKGPGPAMQDVMAGQVPWGFLATSVVAGQAKAGKLTALALSATTRTPIAPDVPTAAEAGLPGYNATFGETVWAPKGTPEAVLRRINDDFSRALQVPEVRERMLAVDLPFQVNSPADAAARLRAESMKWTRVAEQIGLQVD
ncbi:MAG: tripartite tricarboxylate transporter substrate-binding protein [Burkholderiales bacterium]